MRIVYIRADANNTIGSGHVMRCLSIACELRKRSMDVEFLLSDRDSAKLIEGTGFGCRILNTDWRRLGSDEDAALVMAVLRGNGAKPVLLVDSYLAGNEYFFKLREYAKLVVMDDLFDDVYDADMVVNYTIQQELFNYAAAYAGKSVKLLLGTRYAPLREQFRGMNVRRDDKSGLLDILLIHRHFILSLL